MRRSARPRQVFKMSKSVLVELGNGDHPYLGPKSLTRPDWPNKHDYGTKGRNLLPYITAPHKHTDQILRDTKNAVLIQDMFPKSKVHLLVLPKWLPHRDLHPHDAFEDCDFLAMVRDEAAEGLKIAMALLRTEMRTSLKKAGIDSRLAHALIDRRDFSKDFRIGIHAHPSQHELHVHIISRDMVSWHRYDAGHYQAFNSPFLVPLTSYPLPSDSVIRDVQFQNSNLRNRNFRCWRCKKSFGTNAYDDLQDHLREEWQLWIREGLEEIASNAVEPALQNLHIVEPVAAEAPRS